MEVRPDKVWTLHQLVVLSLVLDEGDMDETRHTLRQWLKERAKVQVLTLEVEVDDEPAEMVILEVPTVDVSGHGNGATNNSICNHFFRRDNERWAFTVGNDLVRHQWTELTKLGPFMTRRQDLMNDRYSLVALRRAGSGWDYAACCSETLGNDVGLESVVEGEDDDADSVKAWHEPLTESLLCSWALLHDTPPPSETVRINTVIYERRRLTSEELWLATGGRMS